MSSPQNRSPWVIFSLSAFAAVLTILDTVKVNVILTPIQNSLGATTTETQLIVAGYVLAFGIALVPSGRLGDQWSRKGMFLIGTTIFLLASTAALLAPTAAVLVVARIVQGLAAGVLMPQVLGMIQTEFQGQARGKALGLFGSIIGLGTAFGPTLGGFFVGALGEEAGWRWTFGMNIPLVLILIPLAIWLLPAEQSSKSGERHLDLVGVTLMALTVLLIMLPFVLTTGTDSDNPARWWLVLAGLGTGAFFVWWENHYKASGKFPVLDFTLFRYASYRNGVLITTLWFSMMPPLMLLVTLYNQQALGHEAVHVGLISIPFAFISAIVAAIAGRYTYRWATQFVVIGLVIYLLGMIAVAVSARFTPPELVPWVFAGILGLAGIGPGLVMAANQMRTLTQVPLASAGVAGSFQQVGQRLGNAVGIAVATSVFYSLSAGLTRAEAGDVGGLPDTEQSQYLTAFDFSLLVLIGFGALAVVFALIDHRAAKTDSPMNK